MIRILVAMALAGLTPTLASGQQGAPRPPVIDVHLHVSSMANLGGRVVNCMSPLQEYAPRDGRERFTVNDVRSLCDKPTTSPSTDEEYEAQMLKLIEELNIIPVLSGPIDRVHAWRAKLKDPSRVIPSIGMGGGPTRTGAPSVAAVREALMSGRAVVIGEASPQYEGIPPAHPMMEPYFALAEEFDVPIGLHMGLGAPAAAYVGQPNYLASLSSPLLLEPVLRKHPRLRIYVMHAGWPMINDMIALMYSHPQVYVDTGIINWGNPRKEFHTYLRRLVEAGFANRIMFGSDQFMFPESLPVAIEAIETADFLTPAQKRDILYNNAARFLRLKDVSKGRASAPAG